MSTSYGSVAQAESFTCERRKFCSPKSWFSDRTIILLALILGDAARTFLFPTVSLLSLQHLTNVQIVSFQ
jgi:hypothetical protein